MYTVGENLSKAFQEMEKSRQEQSRRFQEMAEVERKHREDMSKRFELGRRMADESTALSQQLAKSVKEASQWSGAGSLAALAAQTQSNGHLHLDMLRHQSESGHFARVSEELGKRRSNLLSEVNRTSPGERLSKLFEDLNSNNRSSYLDSVLNEGPRLFEKYGF